MKRLPREGYDLRISAKRIRLGYADFHGLQYGLETLRQLAERACAGMGGKGVPCLHIRDYPRFSWRGLHLDVARHFFTADFVCRLIDEMARWKLNRFHWHLTDDQGWRLPVSRYPLLTRVGGWRDETRVGHASEQPARFDGHAYGGAYTREEIVRVVAHARERGVEVIPEVDLPGHTQAAIAAYPELGCEAERGAVWTDWGVSPRILNPRPQTLTFLEGVLDELVELFPSPWIHLGGDEVPLEQWKSSPDVARLMRQEGLTAVEEVQPWLTRRLSRSLARRGRTLVGWDEIGDRGAPAGAVIMSWRGWEGGAKAARAGHFVVMCPGSHAYFDHYQCSAKGEPLAIGGYLPLRKVYAFDPVPTGLTSQEEKYILGAQANLWTEYIRSEEQVAYMLFPRLLALSERTWTPGSRTGWSWFRQRVDVLMNGLRDRGWPGCKHAMDAPEKEE